MSEPTNDVIVVNNASNLFCNNSQTHGKISHWTWHYHPKLSSHFIRLN